jgi:hypothetical protein
MTAVPELAEACSLFSDDVCSLSFPGDDELNLESSDVLAVESFGDLIELLLLLPLLELEYNVLALTASVSIE